MDQDAEIGSEEYKGKDVKPLEGGKTTAASALRSPLAFAKLSVVSATTIFLLLRVLELKFIKDDKLVVESKDLFYNPCFLPTKRMYENNGYLLVSCNGGLNQMRAAIADMVVIATYLNVTLIVPELEDEWYWQDHSMMEDIFDVDYFITSLRDKVQILKQLPLELKKQVETESVDSMYPISFADMEYYYDKVLPRIKRNKILHFTLSDARLANNGLPEEIQKQRCRVYYEAMRFRPEIQEVGQKMVKVLRQRGSFLALHLRYEKDMLVFTGCTHGFTREESLELNRVRNAHPRWKHYRKDANKRRQMGSCPLTPEETALALQALGIDQNTTIFIASGKIHANKQRMRILEAAYPNLVRKEMLMGEADLRRFQNHSHKMAALDYIVALESDIFVPTFGGNMAKTLEGHRRYLGFRKTILLDRILVVNLIDRYMHKTLSWEDFSQQMKKAHENRIGKPQRRMEKRDDPRYEDYFYSNPQECLPESADAPASIT